MIDNINNHMENVEETYSNIPGSRDVDYTPIGQSIGIVSIHAQEIEEIASLRAVEAIEDSYGEEGDGAILNHCRRRNLGLI